MAERATSASASGSGNSRQVVALLARSDIRFGHAKAASTRNNISTLIDTSRGRTQGNRIESNWIELD